MQRLDVIDEVSRAMAIVGRATYLAMLASVAGIALATAIVWSL